MNVEGITINDYIKALQDFVEEHPDFADARVVEYDPERNYDYPLCGLEFYPENAWRKGHKEEDIVLEKCVFVRPCEYYV